MKAAVGNRDYGLLTFEIKSVGDLFDASWTEQRKAVALLKTVKKATEQLTKEQEVLKYMVSDKSPVRVLTTLVMPNVTRDQLQDFLNNNKDVKSALCQSLDIPNTADPLEMCLYSDNLTKKEDVEHNMSDWWKQRVASNGPDPAMTDDIYFDLIGRFCGPATLAPQQFRTRSRQVYSCSMAEVVSKIGDCFSRFVLHRYQLTVLKNMAPLLYITGPPGTGKTTVLLMAACIGLEKGEHVHIVSTWPSSLAASHLLVHQIVREMKPSLPDAERRVHMHEFDMKGANDADDFVTEILQAPRNGQNLCIIADEAFCGSTFSDFCEKLCPPHASVYLRLWAANVYCGYPPTCLQEAQFHESLRTPPVVTRQVQRSSLIEDGFVRQYGLSTTPAETDGPRVPKILHGGTEHFGDLPKDCRQCGVEVARRLRELQVGQALGLHYRDVFILTNYYELEDDASDEDGKVHRPACDFIQALHDEELPVRVVETGDSSALKDVAAMSGPDAIVAADASTVRGLERKVVVYVRTLETSDTSEEGFARLDTMSRTTSQLILVI